MQNCFMISLLKRMIFNCEVRGIVLRSSSLVLALLVNIVLARQLDPAGYGVYSYILSWVLMVSMIQRSGLALLTVREVANYRQQDAAGMLSGFLRWAGKLTVLATLTLGLLAIIICEVLVRVSPQSDARLAYYVLPIFILLGLTSFFEAASRGFGYLILGQLGEFIVRHIVQLLVISVILSGLLAAPFSMEDALLSASIGVFAAFLISLFVFRIARAEHPKAPPVHDSRRWLTSFFIHSSSTAISALTGFLGVIVVGMFLAPENVAYLQVAMQLSLLISFVLTALSTLYAPSFAQSFTMNDKQRYQKLGMRLCNIGLLAALAISLFFIFYGRQLLSFVFGVEYVNAYEPLMVMMVAHLLNAATGAAATILNSAQLEQQVLKALLLALIVMTVTIIPLIYLYGVVGAAVASGLCLVTWKAVSVWLAYKHLGILSLPGFSWTVQPTFEGK